MTRGKVVEVEFKPRFVPVGVQPPPKNMGGRVKYADTLADLKKHEGQWCELVSFKKDAPSGPLYARRQTLSSFEGYKAQVRHNPEDHKEHPGGVALWAAYKPAPPKNGKAKK